MERCVVAAEAAREANARAKTQERRARMGRRVDQAIYCFGRENKGGAGASPAPLQVYLFFAALRVVLRAVLRAVLRVVLRAADDAFFLFAAIVQSPP
jgi:hypothetical protein